MRKQHVTDLLSDKIASTFLTLIEHDDQPNSLLWNCLINQNCDKRPCLVVQSGTHTYPTSLQNKNSILFLNTCKYDNYMDLLSGIRNSNLQLQSGTPGPGSFIFIESLTWFLLEYSNDYEFEYWVQQLLTSLFKLSCQSTVHRVVLRFQPVRDQSGGQFCAGSDQIVKLLEAISTSLCRSGPVKCLENRVLQNIDIWHRRTVQGEWSKSTDSLFIFNKPAFRESGQIEMDPDSFTILNFSHESQRIIPSTMESVTPQSTFDLSLSESEKEARSRVILPYELFPTGTTDNTLPSNVNECNIHYTPDCFDDLDDEDPDDDLDV